MPNFNSKAIDAMLPKQMAPLEDDGTHSWTYVTIPTRDITDYPFDGVNINFLHFGAISASNRKCDCKDFPNCQNTGVHKVPSAYVQEVIDRLRIFQENSIKLFSARVNLKALSEIANGNSGGGVFPGSEFDSRAKQA